MHKNPINFLYNPGLKWPLANQPMASNFSFGLVVFSEVNEILVLLAQIIIVFPLYSIILG